MSSSAKANAEVLVLYEHPEWQKPLFAALERKGVRYDTLDLKAAAFIAGDLPDAPVIFNQASPSAYVRGNARAVPLALAYLKALEGSGRVVLNGHRAFALELSKTAQAAMIARLGLRTPRSIVFNDVDALRELAKHWQWPALLKPEQGGSGARIQKVGSYDELRAHVEKTKGIWEPDGVLLLQEYFEHDPERGIVRMELLGGELLYAMRVVSHGRYNLCPSEACNPETGDGGGGICEIPSVAEAPPVEFYSYKEVPAEAVAAAKRIVDAGGIDVGGIEYLESSRGERVFYDVNANSNLRGPIAREHGFDPFDRVADWLASRARAAR